MDLFDELAKEEYVPKKEKSSLPTFENAPDEDESPVSYEEEDSTIFVEKAQVDNQDDFSDYIIERYDDEEDDDYFDEEEVYYPPSDDDSDLINDFEPNPFDPDALVNDYFNSGWIGNFHLDYTLSYAIENNASDIHLEANQPIALTRYKEIVKLTDFPIPRPETMQDLRDSLLNHQQSDIFFPNKEFDFAYTIQLGRYAGRRFRVNLGLSFNNETFVFRTINEEIPSIESLGIPDEIVDWINLPSGVWIVGGATGSGKSTTLASLIHHMQMNKAKKIVTIEKPIEYIYPINKGKALIVQREVGTSQDTLSFYNGITSALRQNPDIILLGEVRDTEEVSELIRAAETGHLAISTIHTNNVPTTINRIFSLFTSEQQNRIRNTLGDALRGLTNQVLVKKKNEDGVFAVREVLTINQEIKDYIQNGEVVKVREYMIKNKITMEHELIKAVLDDKCEYDEAYLLAPDKELFTNIAKGHNLI